MNKQSFLFKVAKRIEHPDGTIVDVGEDGRDLVHLSKGRGLMLVDHNDLDGDGQPAVHLIDKAEEVRESKAPVRKSAKRGPIFGDLIYGVDGPRVAAEIEKGEFVTPAVREFDPVELFRPAGARPTPAVNGGSVARTLSAMAGRASDATVRPVWAQDSFLHGNQEDPDELANTQRFTQTNDTDHTPEIGEVGANHFPGSRIEDGLAEPENFGPPVPMVRRLGNVYIQRSEDAEPGLGEAVLRHYKTVSAQTLQNAEACGYGEPVRKALDRMPAPKPGPRDGRFSMSFADVVFGS